MPSLLIRSVVLGSIASAVLAQGPRPVVRAVEDVLPASTYFVMRFGGLEACRTAAARSPLAPIVQQFLGKLPDEVREQIDQPLDQAAAQLQHGLQRLGLRIDDVRAIARQPMAFAVGRLSIEGFGPSVALLIEEGDADEAMKRSMGALLQQLPRLGMEMDVARTGSGGSGLQLQVRGGPVIFQESVGGVFVLTNSRGLLQECKEVAAGKQPSLAASTNLQRLRAQLPAEALVSSFVNVRRLLDSFAPHLPYEAEQYADALGVGGIDDYYTATVGHDAGGTDVWQLGLRGQRTGLLKALVQAPCDLSFARACSVNTVAFAAGSVDAPAVVDAFRRFAALLPADAGAEMMRELHRELAREFRGSGTSPAEVDTLLRAFGNQIGIALALEKGPVPKPELLLRVSVRDAGVVGALLQRLEAAVVDAAGLEWKSRKVGAVELRFCNLPIEDADLQLSPCYALVDGALWFGTDTAGLVRSLKRLENGAAADAENLATQADFTAMAQRVGPASGVLHLRLQRAAEIGWRTVETVVYPMLDGQQERIGFGSDALPDAETIAKALGTSTFVYHVDDERVRVEGHGTLTIGALLAAMGSLGDAVMGRAGAKIN